MVWVGLQVTTLCEGEEIPAVELDGQGLYTPGQVVLQGPHHVPALHQGHLGVPHEIGDCGDF